MIFRKSTASNPTTSRTLGTNWVFSYVDNLLYIYRKELMKDTKLSIKLSRNLFVWILIGIILVFLGQMVGSLLDKSVFQLTTQSVNTSRTVLSCGNISCGTYFNCSSCTFSRRVCFSLCGHKYFNAKVYTNLEYINKFIVLFYYAF